MNNLKSEQAVRVVNIPLGFSSAKLNDNSKRLSPKTENHVPATSFNDTQYKVRLLRYTAHLRHLIDNPPAIEHNCSESDIHSEQIDNYLWVMAEFMNGMYEANHKSKV
ncbi:MAG: hypothetical protein DIZ80_15100 [endosymbiont of Galathealinum brachiosum]|uniref:Uncharacterized protein n=1 Tax=endosymbiont of Galathealinum brachiosum TaxID=2200906 RepID=A0A370D928_9GAMM|nr:MAG: hypothetical protein DIZ80_15100 [endosymbiont of Galathealinum brachiosum]